MVRSLQEKSMSYDQKSGWIGDKYVPQIGDYEETIGTCLVFTEEGTYFLLLGILIKKS